MSVLCSEVFLVEWAIIIRYIDVVEEKKQACWVAQTFRLSLLFTDVITVVEFLDVKQKESQIWFNSYLGEIIEKVSKYSSWFEKSGSRNLVGEKWLTRKKVVLYHKSTFFQVGEKWLTRKKNPSLQNHFSRTTFLHFSRIVVAE